MLANENIRRYLVKPAVIGLTGYGISKVIDSGSPKVNLFGMKFSGPVGFGVATALSSEISEVANQFIFPHIDALERLSRTESLIMTPIVGALSYYGLIRFSDPGRVRGIGMNLMAIGGASVLAGQKAYDLLEAQIAPGVPSIDF